MPDHSLSHRIYLLGCRVSDAVSNIAGHPTSIFVMAAGCAAALWFGGKDQESSLALVLAVLAITLTQMVLNQQRRSEAALHLKLDELIHSQADANDEMAGIEQKEVEELEALR
jgi:low affinity Fe/Cu permease